MIVNRKFLVDLAERVGSTFLGGALVVAGTDAADWTSLSMWQSAGVAGGLAVVALLKGLAARWVGDKSPGLKK